MAYEIVRTREPSARFLRDYTDLDQKKEKQLEILRNVDYQKNGSLRSRVTNVFSWRLPFCPINPKHIIDQAILKKRAPKKLPDISMLYNYYVFSCRIKDVVTELEPGVHEFFPIKIYRHDKSEFYEYFAIHVATYVDCVAVERSGYIQQTRDNGSTYWVEPSEPQQTFVHRDKIAGLHYWRDQSAGRAFFSEEVVEILGDDFMPKGEGLLKAVVL